MQAVSNNQTIRFRRPIPQSDGKESTPGSTPVAPKIRSRPIGLLPPTPRDVRKPPWCPSFSGALRILLLVRTMAAMYRAVSDCDEVFNYWEPLHLLTRSPNRPSHTSPFQTWEYSPLFAMRSWTYLLIHIFPSQLAKFISPWDKRPQFFALRLTLGAISSLVEAKFYVSTVENIHPRVGRYLLTFLAVSAGMWEAATAFIPSTFAMYLITIAYSLSMTLSPLTTPSSKPSLPSPLTPSLRTFTITFLFAAAALLGWPFAVVMALPWIAQFCRLDEFGNKRAVGGAIKAFQTLAIAGVGASTIIVIPQILIDSSFYGFSPIRRLFTIPSSFTPLNLINYNLLSHSATLYGVEPPHYYLQNLALNFNLILPLFLFSIPALAISIQYIPKYIGIVPVLRPNPALVAAANGDSSKLPKLPSQITPKENILKLGFLLSVPYVWFGLVSLQKHKEERFGFPAYPMVCLAAAVTLFLTRCWLEKAYTDWTKSEWKASQTSLFRTCTVSVMVLSGIVSFSRCLATYNYYHAPFDVLFHFQTVELPHLAVSSNPQLYPSYNFSLPHGEQEELIDILPGLEPLNISLCYSKEWHRFPGTLLVPDGVRVEWVKSAFAGIAPRRWRVGKEEIGGENGWSSDVTGRVEPGFNDMNLEELDRNVPVSTCTYLVDVDFPHRYPFLDSPSDSTLEPRYVQSPNEWERVFCVSFLDAQDSSRLTRTFWLPGSWWQRGNRFGEYCLLKNKNLDSSR